MNQFVTFVLVAYSYYTTPGCTMNLWQHFMELTMFHKTYDFIHHFLLASFHRSGGFGELAEFSINFQVNLH